MMGCLFRSNYHIRDSLVQTSSNHVTSVTSAKSTLSTMVRVLALAIGVSVFCSADGFRNSNEVSNSTTFQEKMEKKMEEVMTTVQKLQDP